MKKSMFVGPKECTRKINGRWFTPSFVRVYSGAKIMSTACIQLSYLLTYLKAYFHVRESTQKWWPLHGIHSVYAFTNAYREPSLCLRVCANIMAATDPIVCKRVR